MSEISNVCNALEGHALQAIKIVHHHANGLFDWLISKQQSVNPSTEAISILSGKNKTVNLLGPCLSSVVLRHLSYCSFVCTAGLFLIIV